MGPHHGIRGTAWTGRVTSPWEPNSVKPGGLIKITIKKNKIGVDQYKKTLEKTKWINTADQYLRDRKKLVGELQNKNIYGERAWRRMTTDLACIILHGQLDCSFWFDLIEYIFIIIFYCHNIAFKFSSRNAGQLLSNQSTFGVIIIHVLHVILPFDLWSRPVSFTFSLVKLKLNIGSYARFAAGKH